MGRFFYLEFLWLCSPALTCCSCEPPCLPEELELLSDDDALLLPPDLEPPFGEPLVDAMMHSCLRDRFDPSYRTSIATNCSGLGSR